MSGRDAWAVRSGRTGLPWRSLALWTAAAAVGTTLVALAALAVGFELQVGFFVLLAVAVAGLVWVIRYVVHPAERVAVTPQLDVSQLQNRNADWRVRKLEEFIGGAQPRYAMTNTELRSTIAAIARSRIGEPDEIDRTRDRHPRLADYLAADPPPPLTRASLHQIIKELSAS